MRRRDKGALTALDRLSAPRGPRLPSVLRTRRTAVYLGLLLGAMALWFSSYLGARSDLALRLDLAPPAGEFDWQRLQRLGVRFYVYPDVGLPMSQEFAAMLQAFRRSPLAVQSPAEASLLVPGVDTRNNRNWLWPAEDIENGDTITTASALWGLPYWDGGRNHVIFQTHDLPQVNFNFGSAVLFKSSLTQGSIRRGFDVVTPIFKGSPETLPAPPHPDALHAPRRYLLAFKGKRYLSGRGSFRSRLLEIPDGAADVKICTRCHEGADASPACAAEERVYASCDYADMLTNTTFALVPGGRQHASFRLREAMAVGAIPVIFDDRTVLPFDEVIPWGDIAVWHGETESMAALEPKLRAVAAQPGRLAEMRDKGQQALEAYLRSSDAMVAGLAEVFRRRAALLPPL